MRIFTLSLMLFSLTVSGQLQNPDECVNYYYSNGSYQYSGHGQFTYDPNTGKTLNEIGIDTATGDSLYEFQTNHITPHHSETIARRPDGNGGLERRTKYEQETDPKGFFLKSISSNWVGGAWVIQDYSTRDIYTYANGEIVECLRETYLNGAWSSTLKTTYTFNGAYEVTIELYSPDGNGGWERYQKRKQTNNGKVVVEEVSTVDPQTNAETPSSYQTYTVNGASHSIDPLHPEPFLHNFKNDAHESTVDVYDQNATLQLFSKTEYTKSGDSTIATTDHHNGTSYEHHERQIKVVDQKGQTTHSVTQGWNFGSWDYLHGFRLQRTYNGNQMTHVTTQQYNPTSQQFDGYSKVRYKFSSTTGLSQRAFTFKIYPNPVADYLSIENSENETISYEMLDVSGLKVKEGNLGKNNLTKIDMTDLTKGIYLVILRNSLEKEILKHKVTLK